MAYTPSPKSTFFWSAPNHIPMHVLYVKNDLYVKTIFGGFAAKFTYLLAVLTYNFCQVYVKSRFSSKKINNVKIEVRLHNKISRIENYIVHGCHVNAICF